MSTINYPIVGVTKDQKVFVSFYINNKRYRLFNGKRINSNLNPNSFPIAQRENYGNLLAAEVYKYVNEGGVLIEYRTKELVVGSLSDLEYLNRALSVKLSGNYSTKYKEMLVHIYKHYAACITSEKVDSKSVSLFLSRYTSPTSYNTARRHLNALINEARNQGMESSPLKEIKSVKGKAKLNKPFEDIKSIIDEVTAFNDNLGLCCLITYGCLLRPHREVRELTWGDFSEDLKQINLSGSRNKSGRNRIVPVPYYVQERLSKGEPHQNIFTGMDKAPNPDYFKTIWGRFKKVSKLLEQDQTLYSFRHSGAIEIYKRTGSLSKLQKAMGHSSLAVSLTYLRGLEVAELEENDMPII
jgi:integrase